MTSVNLGTRVRVEKKHWARARAWGEVVEILENGRLVIAFEKQGIGYDNGWKLQLGQEDLES